MIAFRVSFLETWKARGFRFILVLPREKYGVLRPIRYDKPLNKGFTIELSEIGLLQLPDNYFFTMDKDVHIETGWQRLAK